MHKTFLYCTDDNYSAHTTVSIFSLLISTSSTSFDICIIGNNLSEEKVYELSKLSEVFQVNINIIEGANYCEKYNTFWSLNESKIDHLSQAALLRLAFNEILPVEYERIVYIDVDTIIRGDLSSLFDINLDDKIIAAAKDLSISNRFKEDSSKSDYFNSGVMVIDRVAWKQHGVDEFLAEIMRRESARQFTYADQDVLNSYFQDFGYKKLDFRYNYQYLMIYDHIKHPPGVPLGEAKIIHYAGQVKPWHLYASEEYSSLYCSFRKVIPWLESHAPEPPKSFEQHEVCAKFLLAQGRFKESAIYSQKIIRTIRNSYKN